MAISAFLRRSPAALIFEGVWLLLGLASLAQGVIGLRDPQLMLNSARNSYGVVIAFGALALATSVTHAMRGRSFCFVGGFAGGVLALYGVALILLGHEDVGGLHVALPFGLASIVLGVWTMIRAVRRSWGERIEVA
jgi:hypothetical protein